MHTPSLRNRVVVLGVVVMVVVLVAVNVVLFIAFRAQLLHNLDDVLDERAELVSTEAGHASGADLAARLTELGVPATLRSPDGRSYRAEPPSPLLGRGLPPAASGSTSRAASRDVQLPDGSTATVFARRTGVDDAQRKLILLDGIGVVIAALLAALLLRRTSGFALRPLEQIAASARRTSAGRRGERLRPDRPGTSLGVLASAYDEMLDSLEASAKQAEDAQTEIELVYLYLRQVIETANAAFIQMDASGVITDWNRKAQEIFGWTEREALGRPLAETLVPAHLRQAHTAGVRRFLDTGEHRVLGKTVAFEALCRDGRLVPVELTTWVTSVGDQTTFNALLHDITERRAGEEAIGRLASIVESAQEAIVSTSLDGTVLTWNLGAERMYGYLTDEAVGRHMSLIVPADRADEIANTKARVLRGEGVPRYETVRRRKDGSLVDVAVSVSPIFDGWGAVTGASSIARDITEQRRMARELDRTLAALRDAVEEARRSEERSRQFLADAAHQLRSPIAGVRACTETMLRATVDDNYDALLADLVRETARAGRLINSLLRLARLDQGRPPDVRPCDLVALCETQAERTRAVVPRLEVSVDVGELPEEPPKVDPDVVTEILSNLLDNARRHARTTIRVCLRVRDGLVRILVADDGPGIADDAVGKVFHRFVSLDGKGGSGLGLPIAQGLARASGGDLTYDRDGFLLVLPVRIQESEQSWLYSRSH